VRRSRQAVPEDERVVVDADSDVVLARQKGREVAAAAGFTGTDLTVIATAISEMARNIVKFAQRGELVLSIVVEGDRTGLRIVARDSGPGIADVARALEDGHSTYRGLGLGLPGARRLMDEFDIVTGVGEGTTVSMIKWRT
jgi:anti-sigma regulatory factor (Ser/Thr protein kinase)